MIKEFWQTLGSAAKAGLVAGIVLIVGATIAIAVWLVRTDYEVLFSGLSPQDAAAMTAELDRMKQPYRLGPDGTTILVDKSTMHQTRLKLMSRDIPLHGAVGFELFNNNDFGMTEFAQKVNFQRALQGEITRTILSISEVETVRVHIAFPEEGLFKREQSKAKASITLALKHGQSLRPEQVAGIQRLVSAAVPGVAPQDVTIVNQQGVALTRAPASSDLQADGPVQLELKKEIEQHLSRKVSQVLDRTFGSGSALASVDVTLDMNQVRVTTEEVTGPPSKGGDARTGVIVRERETVKDESAALPGRESNAAGGSTHRETDYQVGRRVEQVVSQPGSIQQIQVVAVVKAPLDAHQLEQLKTLIGGAVGAQRDRGDIVVVQSMDALGTAKPEGGAAPVTSNAPDNKHLAKSDSQRLEPVSTPHDRLQVALAGLMALVIALGVAILVWQRRSNQATSSSTAPGLSPEQRQAALHRVQSWVAGNPATQGPER
ncbi:MAG: flagellar M-ring protein FliF [Rhizobacter sp.]|nr:flagellar M-ring protein FliF [Rhizobacter sp.]